jgi:hypothetical protein
MAALRHTVLVLLMGVALAACSGGAPAPAPDAAPPSAQAEAQARLGDAVLHVSAVQTSQLPEAVAGQYGIERSPRRVMLLVNVQDGDAATPVRVDASVTDLRGGRQPLEMREIAVAMPEGGTARDYIGTVDTTLPETLRFEVTATRGDARATVQVSRDFYPQ